MSSCLLIIKLHNFLSLCVWTISWLGSGPKCRRFWWWTRYQSAANEPCPLCEDSDERFVFSHTHTRIVYWRVTDVWWGSSWLWLCHLPSLLPCSAADCSEFSLHCVAASVWMKRSRWRRDKAVWCPESIFHLRNLLHRHFSPLTHTASPVSLNVNVNITDIQYTGYLLGLFYTAQ